MRAENRVAQTVGLSLWQACPELRQRGICGIAEGWISDLADFFQTDHKGLQLFIVERQWRQAGIFDQGIPIARRAFDIGSKLAQGFDVPIQRTLGHACFIRQTLGRGRRGQGAENLHQLKETMHPGHGPTIVPLPVSFWQEPACSLLRFRCAAWVQKFCKNAAQQLCYFNNL
jgi:hypothetical protein